MNNFNRMNAPRLARETFAAALDAELRNLTGSGVKNYFSALEINRLFNYSQTQSGPMQDFVKRQALVMAARRQQAI